MKIRVLGRTEMKSDIDIEKVKRFGGVNAGICYSSKPFFESLMAEDVDKSIKRYDNTISKFHHSVGNHFEITILIEGVSKMMAMLLNSFTFYNTSERSGRYTKMGNGEMYDKWFNIFKTRILEEYPEFDEKYAEKLAMENARYILPIFQKTTTMSYTTSIMEFNYICHWFERFIDEHLNYSSYDECNDINFETMTDKIYFYENIISEMKSFIDNIKTCSIYMEDHVDNKDRKITFFEDKRLDDSTERSYEVHGRTYEIVDTLTFPAFADLLRHRTYNKSIVAMYNKFAPKAYIPEIITPIIMPSDKYIIPEILKNTEYESTWVEDMDNCKYIPQGKLITIRELGNIDYFVLKAKERLCSRVQLEVLRTVTNQIYGLIDDMYTTLDDKHPYAFIKLSEIYNFNTRKIKTKCEIIGECKEPCVFGKNGCFSRKI